MLTKYFSTDTFQADTLRYMWMIPDVHFLWSYRFQIQFWVAYSLEPMIGNEWKDQTTQTEDRDILCGIFPGAFDQVNEIRLGPLLDSLGVEKKTPTRDIKYIQCMLYFVVFFFF